MTAGAGCVHGTGTATSKKTKPGFFGEPARDIPLREDSDVIVCGGGPAGFAAALTAARAGARTRLFDLGGGLGGVWTAGLLTFIFDFDKPGITRELVRKLDERSVRSVVGASLFVYHPEDMKLLLEEMCVEAGVKFQLHTGVTAAYRNANRLGTIVTESKSGREAWAAKVFIDATGDGDLGALAGCGWDFGREEDSQCQPLTLNALVVVKDAVALKDYISFYGGKGSHQKAWNKFKDEIHRAGMEPSYGHPTLFQARGNLLTFMINHEYGIKPFDAAKMSEATVRARAEVHRIAKALRTLGGVWEDFQVVATAEQIGIRDGRRIHGRYKVTRKDLVSGIRHPDGVARVTFNVDIHAVTKDVNKNEPISHGNLKMKPYDIPLRALIAKDVDGLMMAGRCISGDFISHASYRVTGNSVATGEAAGAVAALAAKSKRLPHEVDWAEADQLLKKISHRS
ncbi:MAG: FAD-dependent oxidoreductase [Kiritimatiellae bacterium]|nr:FAD-dependent oxidoreductase [Kiritimatiellia bacterium]